MRWLLAVALASVGLAVAPHPAGAAPGVCPPFCDTIPASAWPVSSSLPLYAEYAWPGLAGLAVSARSPRFVFEELCASPAVPADPRAYVVAERAEIGNGPGQWHLRSQVLHWRGPVGWSGPLARSVVQDATARLRSCQATAPLVSPSITTAGAEEMAAVISVGGQKVAHQYLLADPSSATVVELALWTDLPAQVPWPGAADAQVLDALAAPLCQAYLGSCR
ncbi:ATPase [Mycolicibacterium flavescens]|uniref:ATPase n=1 Tax=Mycolicibacterium flavescens TaxID=1776 RepID=A0A1E3RJJ4_MYCFV|nr:ATPase [Mycolicibacterium flavescens]MCV7280560.1 ATPase [Mycolicibacterium flavescens]ODQ90055.1 ATPase [Mycolicibacterium flavescens]